ncbi:acetyl/propionyl/methylcrotonyl-CoA carboxylase subunit alpha [Ramlibacter albus]|uniref:ATP-grasp domain-containing protein n=1 Tax=Ramlibacter albus TaxID=2079448 RepID=A0A923S3B1_9BURK|nr:biotin carboxylase N-terminal domain-containing protein [Ramlibacter albus]MBC5762937.1 ATP-grasp domain-containing protein [Ramlibacter albus]
MFSKILIANRGEIACRIARTCRRLGVAAAGVHSAADRNALHVREIGESVEIGGAAAAQSYLRIDAVIAAARAVAAEAIHPGFGFLAENAAFARAVEAAGLVFIGPTPEVIERLGDKAAAKREAEAAGVPIVPGSQMPSTDPVEIAATVRRVGLPVMLKAAAGGGGKGMRGIQSMDGLEQEIESAMREAKNAFGDAGLIVEKLIRRGRHIEIQIAGDGEGEVIHLFERECTLQRRHQKVIEEAPAANLDPALRDRMAADAVRLGQRLKYRGVGTVEFIVGEDEYHFLEVNPRLQVEHPVTEAITGIDIVEVMMRIASGEGLPLRQEDVAIRGHAVEARICAEDPAANFLPSTGRISQLEFPRSGVRVETGVESGSEVTPFYDSMLAKLITHAPTRDEALDRLDLALGETTVFGVTSNIGFLRRLVDLPETRKASFHTRLIDEQIGSWALGGSSQDSRTLAIAAAYWLRGHRRDDAGKRGPWTAWAGTGWQLRADDDGLSPIPSLHVESADGASAEIRFGPVTADGALLVGAGAARIRIGLEPAEGEGHWIAVCDTLRERVALHQDGDMLYVRDCRGAHVLKAVPYLAYISAASQASGDMKAPMMGLILKVQVAPGDRVEKGAVVAILESMKMEMRILSDCQGTVASVACQAGQTVERNALLASITPD